MPKFMAYPNNSADNCKEIPQQYSKYNQGTNICEEEHWAALWTTTATRFPSLLWWDNVTNIRRKGWWETEKDMDMACLDGSQDNTDLSTLNQTSPTHTSSGLVLMEPGSPLKVQLLAQVLAGLWCNHTVQFAYSANFGLDTAFPRESQMPLLPAASCSTCLCTTGILLLTKWLRIRDTTVPDSYLDVCNPMKSVRTQDLIWVKNLNTSVDLDLNPNPCRGKV